MADFFTLVNSSKTVAIYNNTDQDYEHVHGLNVSHFTVCQEDLETSTVRELTFCFAPKDFASVDPKIKEELLLIDAKIFNKSSNILRSQGK